MGSWPCHDHLLRAQQVGGGRWGRAPPISEAGALGPGCSSEEHPAVPTVYLVHLVGLVVLGLTLMEMGLGDSNQSLKERHRSWLQCWWSLRMYSAPAEGAGVLGGLISASGKWVPPMSSNWFWFSSREISCKSLQYFNDNMHCTEGLSLRVLHTQVPRDHNKLPGWALPQVDAVQPFLLLSQWGKVSCSLLVAGSQFSPYPIQARP